MGVDVGGTKIAVAVLEGGELTESTVTPTNQASQDALVEQLVTAIEESMGPSVRAVGIGMPSIIEFATEIGIGIDVRPIDSGELLRSPEVFLTSSLRAIAPVVRIDDRSIGDGKPGLLTRRVMEAYSALVSAECRG